jgi:hypothetical protein
MNIEKYQMVERQLICRGIREPQIIDAFLKVDREHFVPSRYKNIAYVDQDIVISNNAEFMLKPYTLARILQKLLSFVPAPEKLLIVGNDVKYTIAILKNIYSHGCESTTEKHLLSADKGIFDIIFFDTKIYSQSAISHGKFVLKNTGKLIFFKLSNPIPCLNLANQMSPIHVEVIEQTYDGHFLKLFSTIVFYGRG